MSPGPQRPPGLGTNSLTVRVLYKPAQQELASAEVIVHPSSAAEPEHLMSVEGSRIERTDARGLAVFYDLEPGDWTVSVNFSSGATLVGVARRHVGSTAWAKNVKRSPYGRGDWKCNLFVYDMIAAAGYPTPPMNELHWGLTEYPPLAKQWADPTNTLATPGGAWVTQTTPWPGDIAARAVNYADASGHVGIVSDPAPARLKVKIGKREHKKLDVELAGQTISATETDVKENDWGFRATDASSPTFKRFQLVPAAPAPPPVK